VTHEILRELPLFAGLSESDISLLEERSSQIRVAPAETLVQEGTPSGSLYVILEGEFEILKRSENRDVLLAVRGAGEVIGEMSLLDRTPRSATVRSLTPSLVLEIDQDAFRHLVASSPSAALSILRTITSRLRNTESMLRQSEKMAALGTLAAGLAHELNNPAAALARAAQQLEEALRPESGAAATGGPATNHPAQIAAAHFLAGIYPGVSDPLELSDREDRLRNWLEGEGVEEAWQLAGNLVAAGLDVRELSEAVLTVPAAERAGWLAELARSLSTYRLLREIRLSAGRISEIVRAVKSYTYLDQAPIQMVDIHAGLEDTLVVLRAKIEPGIRVVRNYDPHLPQVEAYGSELNQVWTNLIDNACQAMAGSGELSLSTAHTPDEVSIDICDTGRGIPPAIQKRIFEPFFTTKAPGEGTGLGLHLVYNLIVLHHRGRIDLQSSPGKTCFTVAIPIRRSRGDHEG
jgi:signal transduction histidine kinase